MVGSEKGSDLTYELTSNIITMWCTGCGIHGSVITTTINYYDVIIIIVKTVYKVL